MKKWLGFGALLAALVFAAWWFWSLGALPAEASHPLRLQASQGIVEVKRSGQNDWQAVNGATDIAKGDSVRTGANSNATISVYGSGETRLGAQTELIISDTTAPANTSAPFLMKMQLSSGRVWTRLLRLLDLESSFTIQSNNVTATVRGTAFDMRATEEGTVLWVSDSGVEVTGSKPLVVNEGSMAQFDASGALVTTHPLTNDDRQSDWFTKNTTIDRSFAEASRVEERSRLAGLGGRRPDSAADALTHLSERMHLALAGQNAPSEFARYSARRLYLMTQLIDEGKSGLAFQTLSQLEDDVSAHLKGSDAAQYRVQIQRELKDITRLLENADPSSGAYRLKQRVEDLLSEVSDQTSDKSTYLYTRLVAIESSLMVADAMLDAGSVSSVAELLDAAKQGLSNVEKDISLAAPNATGALQGKLSALKIREAGLRARLAALQQSSATTTGEIPAAIVPTSTTPTVTTTVPALPALKSIQIFIQPNPVLAGATAKLSVKGTRQDGSISDLTATSRFEIFGTIGSLNGPTFTSNVAGSVTIKATVNEQGKAFSSSYVVQITQPAPIPTRLDLIPAGQTTIPPGGQLPITATVTYSDGSSKDVTATATYAVSDPTIGSMVTNIFNATQQQNVGSVRITGRYQEGNAVVSGTVDINVR